MTEMRFASAYERAAEQAMSDEHVLGALPEDASGTLLDWQLSRLRAAANEAVSEEDFYARSDAIRAEARSAAYAAAGAGDDATALAARLEITPQPPVSAPVTDAARVAAIIPADGQQDEIAAYGIPTAPELSPAVPPEEILLPEAGVAIEPQLVDGVAAPAAEETATQPPELPLPPEEAEDLVPLGVAALSAAPTTKRRRRSRKSQPESADLTAVAEDVAAEALTRGGRAARRRPWLALALGVALVAAIAILLVVLMGRDDASEQAASEAPPLPGGGWYEAMFTTPQRTGTPPAGSSGRLDQRLVQLIDGAQGSVDIAAYDFGLDNVADALIAAHHRGVVVRVVTDSDNKDNPPLKKLRSADIPVVEDQRRALMHHKFAVIDGRTVMTGAWNFAERDTFRHDNNSVVWNSEELARNFSNEFNKMFEGRRFGPTKPKDVPNPVVERDGTRVETYFASEQQVDPLIAERLRAARSSIAFMAFSFTLDDLGEILQDRRKDGVGVWGVIEATGSETEFSEYGKLKTMQPASPAPPFPGCNAGSAVLQDNNPFLLHHKVFVIDEKTVIFGSFNFTSNAAEDNDEALLIVDDPALAQRFLTEFCRVYNVALTRTPARR